MSRLFTDTAYYAMCNSLELPLIEWATQNNFVLSDKFHHPSVLDYENYLC